jgi:ornithine carbamoyltransferase
MSTQLYGRSFLTLLDFSAVQINQMLTLAARLKTAKRVGTERPQLAGKNIALIFEKDSTRTRAGFEVAAHDQGAHVTYLGPSGSHIGHKESIADTARVLGRMFDAIEYRGFDQASAETLARLSGVPVYNGLTDDFHPTQVLADFLTMQEHNQKPLAEIAFCYLGDASGNMAASLMIGAGLLGLDLRICAPRALWPAPDLVTQCQALAAKSGGKLRVTDDLAAVQGCDFLYTDVWVSMGEAEAVWAERIRLLTPYRVTSALMAATGNPQTKFLHCLPAFHNAETEVGQSIENTYGISCMEVTDAVFESPASVVFDQAENRLHTIKAVLVATLAA